MPWYAAHAIMYFRFKDGKQDYFTAWENVYLVQAAEGEDPRAKATEIAESNVGEDATLTCDGRPVEMVFAGIRKIISVAGAGEGETPAHGDELTYSKMIVADEPALRRLVGGGPVTVKYVV